MAPNKAFTHISRRRSSRGNNAGGVKTADDGPGVDTSKGRRINPRDGKTAAARAEVGTAGENEESVSAVTQPVPTGTHLGRGLVTAKVSTPPTVVTPSEKCGQQTTTLARENTGKTSLGRQVGTFQRQAPSESVPRGDRAGSRCTSLQAFGGVDQKQVTGLRHDRGHGRDTDRRSLRARTRLIQTFGEWSRATSSPSGTPGRPHQ